MIHKARIVHSDLKPPNFLVVEGNLKLIDFGIAKAIQNGTTSIARESQCGTLNYMAPEAVFNGMPSLMDANGGMPKKVCVHHNHSLIGTIHGLQRQNIVAQDSCWPSNRGALLD